jgi:hypothetical protein
MKMGQSLGGMEAAENPLTHHIMTGELRRAICPVALHHIPDAPSPTLLAGSNVDLQVMVTVATGMFVPPSKEPSSKQNLFWMTVTPADLSSIKAVVVFHHGFGDHAGWYSQSFMTTLCSLYVL